MTTYCNNFLRIVRSIHRRCSVKKGVLRNFTNFKGKHLCWSLFLVKLQAFWPATLLIRDSSTSVWIFKVLLPTLSIIRILNLFVISLLWLLCSLPNIFYWKSSIPYWYWFPSETTAKTHSELTQTSKMKVFAKVVNCWEPITNLIKSSIVDVWLDQEYASVSVSFLAEKGRGRYFTVHFASFLCNRKKVCLVISYISFFHSRTSTMTCYNTYLLLR